MTLYTTNTELHVSSMRAEQGRPDTWARLFDAKGNEVRRAAVFEYKIRNGTATIKTWEGETLEAEIDEFE